MASSPYYNRPPQAGIIAHFTAIADSTDLPLMTYDIPRRTGVSIETETLVRLAEHPRIIANKDAKGDLEASQWAMARTDLAWYSGEDALNLALLAVGASGMVSVVGHLVGDRLRDMAEALWSGDIVTAQKLNESMLPVFTGIFRSQGVILTKAALQLQGLPSGPVRLPLVNATDAEIDQLIQDLTEGGVVLTHARP
jgi:4-hydroxy-tetrahydrodipicolinate synthase